MKFHKLPGTRIEKALSYFQIKSGKCGNCQALAKKMDEAGGEEVYNSRDSYTREMYESIKKWRRNKVIVPQPPLIVVKRFIEWACIK